MKTSLHGILSLRQRADKMRCGREVRTAKRRPRYNQVRVLVGSDFLAPGQVEIFRRAQLPGHAEKRPEVLSTQ